MKNKKWPFYLKQWRVLDSRIINDMSAERICKDKHLLCNSRKKVCNRDLEECNFSVFLSYIFILPKLTAHEECWYFLMIDWFALILKLKEGKILTDCPKNEYFFRSWAAFFTVFQQLTYTDEELVTRLMMVIMAKMMEKILKMIRNRFRCIVDLINCWNYKMKQIVIEMFALREQKTF